MTNKPFYGIWKFLILNYSHFPGPTFQDGFGEAIYQQFSALRSEFPYHDPILISVSERCMLGPYLQVCLTEYLGNILVEHLNYF